MNLMRVRSLVLRNPTTAAAIKLNQQARSLGFFIKSAGVYISGKTPLWWGGGNMKELEEKWRGLQKGRIRKKITFGGSLEEKWSPGGGGGDFKLVGWNYKLISYNFWKRPIVWLTRLLPLSLKIWSPAPTCKLFTFPNGGIHNTGDLYRVY